MPRRRASAETVLSVPLSRQGPLDKGSAHWEDGELAQWGGGSLHRQPPSDGGEGGLRFGGSVCSISHVQTKAKLHLWGPENWGRRWQKHPLPHNPFLQSLPPPSPAGPDLNLEGAPVP